MASQQYSLTEIAQHLGAALKGKGDCLITGLAPIQSAKPGQLCFLSNSKYRKYLGDTEASAVILSDDEAAHCQTNALISENPYLAYAKVAKLFAPKVQHAKGLHSSVVVGAESNIDSSASIGAHCSIGDHVVIGANVVVEAGTVIGDHCIIGAGTHLSPRVVLYYGVQIGESCVIHSGAVIGSDGFGMANHQGEWIKIPQLGAVIIGNRVEIGANTTIDRGALEDTLIGNGVKLDNQIQVGHNVTIGENTAIAGCTGISGSTTIGRNCAIGGGCGIVGHLSITDNVMITGKSTVQSSIDKPGVYISTLAVQETRTWLKNISRLHRLDELARKVNQHGKIISKLQPETTD